MATVRSKQIILNNMLRDQTKHWEITDTTATRRTIYEMQDDNMSVEDSVRLLGDTLDNMEGLVIVKVADRSKADKGKGGRHLQHEYQINLGQPVQGIGGFTAPPVQDSGKLMQEMEARFNDRLDAMQREFEMKREIEDLKRQLSEAQQGSSIENIAIGFIEKIMPGMGNNPPTAHSPALAGHDEPEELTEEHTGQVLDERTAAQMCTTYINRLLKVDPEFIAVLGKLADMAENSPNKYNMAKSFL